jgi:hypothetical protein
MPGPTPESLAQAGTEESEQVALFCWSATLEVRNQYPELQWMFAIPNGGLRNKIVAAKLKAQGVKAGVPDIFLPVSRGKYHGIFVELKTLKGVVSNMQKQWIAALQVQGYAACVCIGWENTAKMLVSYLEWK